MIARKTTRIPTRMEQARQRLERWRSTRPHRTRIPESLWAAAVELARQHGVFRTAKALRLEYGKLKRLVQSAARVRKAAAPPTFVELVAPQSAGSCECLIELEGPRGKMRIQWKGATAPDLSGLSRALWESA